ncbi:hypothetical protein [Streptomyces sp. NBC_00572]|uniref:hypothetical protein n=1 Tax=Streptomyces sp. NBC_00572 TaxID=2903664 RepID=UPI0022537839|nr:hypothetical protein [Streptomyces sp. NBC_00572]MCX4984006.1 hypothetical protein [Streptomyces sp. NBC_00572]
MENPTRKVAAAGAAALLAAGLVVTGAGAASASETGGAERITSTAQLKDSIRLAVAQEEQAGAGLSESVGGRVTKAAGTQSGTC